MKVETDLKVIKVAARKKWDENWEFRSFLKGYDLEVEKLDAIVHRLFEKVYREIDCTACGNCCRKISPILQFKDIERLSRGLGIHPDVFKKRFLKKRCVSQSVFRALVSTFFLSCGPILRAVPDRVGSSVFRSSNTPYNPKYF